MKLFEALQDPFIAFIPSQLQYCRREDVDRLHRETCEILGISDIYPDILWSYTDKLRNALAEAEYWKDENGRNWRIKYDTRRWIALGAEGRKNTIIHEVCHHAVEKLYGHGKKESGERIEDHGSHWQELMLKCGEPPFPEVFWCYR